MNTENIPVGSIVLLGGYSPPDGWLFCDGQRLTTTSHLPLFAAIGYRYGGSGEAFDLPRIASVKDQDLQTYPSAPGTIYPAHPPQTPLRWIIRAA